MVLPTAITCRKWRKADENSSLYWHTNFIKIKHWSPIKLDYHTPQIMKISVACTGLIILGTHQCWEKWYGGKGKIQQNFQGCLCPSCVLPIFFLRNSIEFHDMRMECHRKRILIHFLLYYLFWSLPDHSCPNLLARWSLAPQSLAPQILALQCSLPDRSLPPIARSWFLAYSHPPGS